MYHFSFGAFAWNDWQRTQRYDQFNASLCVILLNFLPQGFENDGVCFWHVLLVNFGLWSVDLPGNVSIRKAQRLIHQLILGVY